MRRTKLLGNISPTLRLCLPTTRLISVPLPLRIGGRHKTSKVTTMQGTDHWAIPDLKILPDSLVEILLTIYNTVETGHCFGQLVSPVFSTECGLVCGQWIV